MMGRRERRKKAEMRRKYTFPRAGKKKQFSIRPSTKHPSGLFFGPRILPFFGIFHIIFIFSEFDLLELNMYIENTATLCSARL